jgi:ATP-dependent Lon protease
VVDNPEAPERPFAEVRSAEVVEREWEDELSAEGELLNPIDVPVKVAEELGYRCVKCGIYSPPSDRACPSCSEPKTGKENKATVSNPFGDLIGVVEMTISQMGVGLPDKKKRVKTTRQVGDREEVVVYEPAGESAIKVLDEEALEKRREFERRSPSKVLLPLDRKPFVLATGSSETELLGDVRHDPYGGHGQLGTPPYERVVAGSIHDAHQGVLYIDELPHLGHLQRFILTAMQEKKFPISGRNPQSAGASVRVDDVPCDFIMVGSCNISDLEHILAPLRSRIAGNGYEVLVETAMEDTPENRRKYVQFIAQEVEMDGRIPHADAGAIEAIVEEGVRRAKDLDGQDDCLTLRLREMGGLIRASGDIAAEQGHKFITAADVKEGIRLAKSAEKQIESRYGSYYGGLARDLSAAQKDSKSPYNYWNQHLHDDKAGYE